MFASSFYHSQMVCTHANRLCKLFLCQCKPYARKTDAASYCSFDFWHIDFLPI